MPENKTQATTAEVGPFIAALADPQQRADTAVLAAMMAEASGAPAAMWGPAIIGFGRYHYRYASGREGDMARIGFSPRKGKLALYLAGPSPERAAILARLGRHSAAVSCLYVKRLADVDRAVLAELIAFSLAEMDARYPR